MLSHTLIRAYYIFIQFAEAEGVFNDISVLFTM